MIKYSNEDNFTFTLCGRYYVMQDGELTIDNCIYENVNEGGAKVYEIARAYALVALGQFQHENLMEKN